MQKKHIIIPFITMLFTTSVLAHGYITSPASRSENCKAGNNPAKMCGSAQWEPQSIEALSGFPAGNFPPDGHLASAGIPRFLPLDMPGDDWHKIPVQAGKTEFVWSYTATHKTRNWRYYITRPDWDSHTPLTRNSFEPEPFCVHDGRASEPPAILSHQCDIPERTGYQVIYGVWEIANTANSFYQVIDVRFD
ncbi:lytic polysaccharide monooxygenase [Morganella psychrotolerans]|uniref:lytic polysaccharide monooxygenase n=1 Tax=Morganella psychrotolerans TaxID=368603 RepID=UPI0039B0C5FC